MERAPLVLTFLAAACASQESSLQPRHSEMIQDESAQTVRPSDHSGPPDDKFRLETRRMEAKELSTCDRARQAFERIFAEVADDCEVGRLDGVEKSLRAICRDISVAVNAAVDVQLEHARFLREKCQRRRRRSL